MKTEFKDVAHLYLGCDVMTPDGISSLKRIGLLGSEEQRIGTLKKFMSVTKGYKFSEIKPILRPILDITEDEMRNLVCLLYKNESYYIEELSKGTISQIDSVGFKISYSPPKDNPLDKGYDWVKFKKLFPSQFLFMLSKQFDLFGLIDSDQAIDKTKVECI